MTMQKSRAVVLRLTEFSETSLIVTLFTREMGKISALAKGARRPKSPFESALDLLAVCRIVFLHKSSDALDLLTEARLERRFRAAARNLSRLYAGYYVAELLQGLTDEADPHPALYDASERALFQLDGDGDVGSTVLGFELTTLRELGHLPTLTDCAACGTAVDVRARTPFGPLAGGVLCERCRAGQRHVVAVSRRGLETLRRAAASPETFSWEGDERQAMGELRGILNHYLAHLLGRKPRMHKYLGILAQEPA